MSCIIIDWFNTEDIRYHIKNVINPMRKVILAIILFVFTISFSQSKKKSTDEEKLTKCIAENTNYFVFNGQRPEGKAWEIIENLFAQNQFVAWGEYHNSPLLSELTTYALESAWKNGYKTWCVEVSPFVAS